MRRRRGRELRRRSIRGERRRCENGGAVSADSLRPDIELVFVNASP